MLMENVSKKDFATVFTKSYGAIMKDFINDDYALSMTYVLGNPTQERHIFFQLLD